MPKLIVFNQVTVDGFIADENGDMSWAHKHDAEWNEFMAGNATGEGALVFGRITYEMMARWWPTPLAVKSLPAVAAWMNNAPKTVFSRTLEKAAWSNTRLVKNDLPGELRRMKQAPGPDVLVFGSGSIISQAAQEGLIDEYQLVVNPLVLGKGTAMFETLRTRLALRRTRTRTFDNGNVILCYEPMV